VRPGTRRDAATIVRLIRGLAEYERLAHECRASLGRIRRDGFGPRRYFQTLVCERDGTAIGFALYFFTYSTFLTRPTLYLEDLFVIPEERGRGADALLAALARTRRPPAAGEWRGRARLEQTVIEFYEALGAGYAGNGSSPVDGQCPCGVSPADVSAPIMQPEVTIRNTPRSQQGCSLPFRDVSRRWTGGGLPTAAPTLLPFHGRCVHGSLDDIQKFIAAHRPR
jgi:GNAT superfamily N-acetyltransferase